MLAKTASGEGTDRLIVGLEETLSAMSGMLDTLLDVNQIEAGIVRPTVSSFPVLDILERLRRSSTITPKPMVSCCGSAPVA